jgi:BSD domain
VCARASVCATARRDLQKLYEQLVQSGVLSDAEFWKGRAAAVEKGVGGSGGAGAGQRVGLPSAMLVQPSADGKTDKVTFRLTPEVIHQIFKEKPHVQRAFVANVPHAMDETAFWTKYFKQQYLQQVRSRGAAHRRLVQTLDRPHTQSSGPGWQLVFPCWRGHPCQRQHDLNPTGYSLSCSACRIGYLVLAWQP